MRLRTMLAIGVVTITTTGTHMVSAQAPMPAFEYRIVAHFDGTAPGGGAYRWFDPPVINAAGTVAFYADVKGFLQTGLYKQTPAGNATLLLPELAGIEEYRFSGYEKDTLMLNDAGDVAFVGRLYDGPNPDQQGEWVLKHNGSGIEVVMRDDDPAPGGPGTLRDPDRLAFNSAGDVAFAARIHAPTGEGIFRTSPTGLVAIARTGDDSLHNNVVITDFQNLSLGDNGFVTFSYAAVGDGPAIGIARGDGETLELVVGPNVPAPGGGTLKCIDTQFPVFNRYGHMLFRGIVEQGDEDLVALFVHDDNGLRRIVTEGDPTPPGDVFDDVPSALVPIGLDATGQATYKCAIGIIFEVSVYTHKDGVIDLIATTDTTAPSYEFWHRFTQFPYAVRSNVPGNVAVLGQIQGVTTYQGLWATDARGDLQEVARIGRPFEYAPGEVYPISNIAVHRMQHGAATGHAILNDQRELAFQTDLGIYVAMLNAADCNRNGIDDRDEINADPSRDDNEDGVLDSCQYSCPADVSGPFGHADSVVNLYDLLGLLSVWGSCGFTCDAQSCPYDIVGDDCVVNLTDLHELLDQWGPCE